MQTSIKIYNTLTRKKEVFKPLSEGYVGIYVCGPTVYSNAHLGNVRTFLAFDVLFRYFKHLGYKVRYVRNITDVGHLVGDGDEGEDKIGRMAKLEQIEPMEVVQRYTNDFHWVLDQFNFLPPSIEPTATSHLIEQIDDGEKDSEFEIILKTMVPPMVDSFAAMLKAKKNLTKCIPCLSPEN